MAYTLVRLPAVQVIGMAFKTKDHNQQSVRDIPNFWKAYFSKNVEASIPHKVEPLKRICVYTSYNPEGYTVIIGACVTKLENVPPALIGRELPPGEYALFGMNGPVEEAAAKAWHHIQSIADLPRAYTHDFELYEYEKADVLREAKIFISVK